MSSRTRSLSENKYEVELFAEALELYKKALTWHLAIRNSHPLDATGDFSTGKYDFLPKRIEEVQELENIRQQLENLEPPKY